MQSSPPKASDENTTFLRMTYTILIIVLIIYAVLRLSNWNSSTFDIFTVTGSSMSVFGMIICGLLILLLWADSFADISTRYYVLMTVEVFFLLTFNALYFMNSGELTHLAFQSAILSLSYAMVPIILMTFWFCIEDDTRTCKPYALHRQYSMVALLLTYYLLLILNMFTEVMFSIDFDGTVIIKYPFLFIILIAIAMTFFCVYDVIARFTSIRQIAVRLIFLILPLIGFLLDLYYVMGFGAVCYVIALLIIYCTAYVWRIEEIIDVDGELKARSTEALLSQIRPHFLYNALTSIMNISGTPMDTRDVIVDFGKYLRGNIDSLTCIAPIPIRKEVELTEMYFEMAKLEYGDNLKLNLELEATNFQIPVMTIRTLTSLCIKYGIAPKGNGTVSISTKETDTFFEVRVADDGVGYPGTDTDPYLVDHDNVAGYSSVKRRLKDMLNASITYYSVVGHGTSFNIRIPKVRHTPEVPAYMRQRGSS